MENIWATVVFDIDGVIRDVGQSYRRAIVDTVAHFTGDRYRPTMGDIDRLKAEGHWNNDWRASQELINRSGFGSADLPYEAIVSFFQGKYRGPQLDADRWDGYITTEPLLLSRDYFDRLTAAGIGWGFFSGATRGSARYVLQRRLGLAQPILVAMEDAPGKPDPTGLFDVTTQLETLTRLLNLPTIYVGDTVADMFTVTAARQKQPQRLWIAVGVLPPHILAADVLTQGDYRRQLLEGGAQVVLDRTLDLDGDRIAALVKGSISWD